MTDPPSTPATVPRPTTRGTPPADATLDPDSAGHLNEVTLVGRVSAGSEQRDLPSGDTLVTFRVVVDRPRERGSTRRSVDVIDVACWTKRVQRSARSLGPDDLVRVEGALRRRFFAAGGQRASRYEVEARRVRRVTDRS